MQLKPVPEMYKRKYSYDSATGSIYLSETGIRADKPATFMGKEYRVLAGRPAHRVAWFLHYGTQPDGHIDHIDGNGANNSAENLRCVSITQNQRNRKLNSNNKTGYPGIRIQNNKYVVSPALNGVTQYVGRFSSLDEAVESLSRFHEANGFHPNHGLAR
jgi:hypothetical protein